MLIADTRPHPQDEADLRWLWCESEGAMGLRSSLGAQLDRLAEGRVTAHQSGTPDLSESAYLAATRQKTILRRLRTLAATHQTTLRAAYGPGLPAEHLSRWKDLGTTTLPPTLMLLVAQRESVPRKRLAGWLTPPKPATLPDDATEQTRAQAKADHAKVMATWKAQAKEGLSALRRDAQVALVQAVSAYGEAARMDVAAHGKRP